MPDSPLSRRRFIGVAGGVAAWFVVAPPDLFATGYEAGRYKVLTTEQAATFDAFAAQVIPSEPGSPGAREAKVTQFADNGLADFAKEQRPEFEKALAALNARSGTSGFAALSSARQIEVMRDLEKANHGAFEALRAPVIAGMFANPSYGGNAGKVGWKLIGFDDRFFWQAPFGFYDQPAEAMRRE
jgi:gluconate 2-dehydrogenase gamma chain